MREEGENTQGRTTAPSGNPYAILSCEDEDADDDEDALKARKATPSEEQVSVVTAVLTDDDPVRRMGNPYATLAEQE